MQFKTLYVACDHAGFELKTQLLKLQSNKVAPVSTADPNAKATKLQKKNIYPIATSTVTSKAKVAKIKIHDLGPFDNNKCDYPDSAKLVLQALEKSLNANDEDNTSAPSAGLLICGSGQGMAMAANRKPFARAALCWRPEVACLARQHNDANILCLGARYLSAPEALQIVEAFLTSPFEGGRHTARIHKL